MRNLLVTTLLLALVACGDNNDNENEAEGARAAGERLGQLRAQETNAELAGDSPDAIIAQSGSIMITIDEGEIAQAQFAVQFVSDPDVRAFANRMIAEHTAHINETMALLRNLGVSPADNPISATLRDESAAGLAVLQRSNNENIDREYMRLQVMQHTEAIFIVQELEALAPVESLAAFEAATVTMITAHRDAAMVILRNL